MNKRLTVVGGCIQGSPSICIGNVLRVLPTQQQSNQSCIGWSSLMPW